MKRIILTLALMLVATVSQAQCVAEVKDVIQDEIRGSIIVQTEYKMNGAWVQDGQTRYTENSGTNAEIIAKAKEAGDIHCKNLIRRLPENKVFLDETKFTLTVESKGIDTAGKTKQELETEYFSVLRQESADRLVAQKVTSQLIIDAIKGDLIGHKVSHTEAVDTYEGKDITVKADKTVSIKDVSVVVISK